MGNCVATPRKSLAEISRSQIAAAAHAPPVRIYGPPSSPATYLIRIALLYKNASPQFFPSEKLDLVVGTGAHALALQCGSDTVTGSYRALLQYVEAQFPKPALASGRGVGVAVAEAAALQHRSILRHLEGMVGWAEELRSRKAPRGGGGRLAAGEQSCMGSPRMEVKKFGRRYSQLLELMLEHAQMEERIVFPVLERADRGLSKAANEEHARDLPIMNGIKEDIKCIGVLDGGSLDYQEAMSNLSSRLIILQEHCKEHFKEEEEELLPMLEAAELSKERQEEVFAQSLEMMSATHSHLFHFLISGLLPQEAMHYVDMVCQCTDRPRVVSMLRDLTAQMESSSPPPPSLEDSLIYVTKNPLF